MRQDVVKIGGQDIQECADFDIWKRFEEEPLVSRGQKQRTGAASARVHRGQIAEGIVPALTEGVGGDVRCQTDAAEDGRRIGLDFHIKTLAGVSGLGFQQPSGVAAELGDAKVVFGSDFVDFRGLVALLPVLAAMRVFFLGEERLRIVQDKLAVQFQISSAAVAQGGGVFVMAGVLVSPGLLDFVRRGQNDAIFFSKSSKSDPAHHLKKKNTGDGVARLLRSDDRGVQNGRT